LCDAPSNPDAAKSCGFWKLLLNLLETAATYLDSLAIPISPGSKSDAVPKL